MADLGLGQAPAVGAAAAAPARPGAGAVLRVVAGNFLEMYDFMAFGFYASAIAGAFFPSGSKFLSLMLALLTFGTGFLMRPLGAVVLGAFIDRRGRRAGLILTLGLMGLGTALIACVPGYASIGMLAPALVLLGRLLQGFSAGAELGGVSVYLSEIAPSGRRGFYVSWQSASQQVAVALVALQGAILGRVLGQGRMADWGWRVPFVIGCLVIPFVFWIRRSLQETGRFLAQRRHPPLAEALRSMARNWRLVASGTMLVVMTTVSFYMITAFTPTFGASVLRLDEGGNLLVAVCVGLSNLFWLPVMGGLSDRVGRRPLLLAFSAAAALSAYPALSWLVRAPSFSRLLGVELWLSFLFAGYNGAMVVALTEMMPADVKTTGFSLAYSLATAVFGGFTPAACTWLIHATGNDAMPGAWLTVAALCGLTAACRMPTSSAGDGPAG